MTNLGSTSTSQKWGNGGFTKPFKSTVDDKEKIPWKFGPIDIDKLKCNHCGKLRHERIVGILWIVLKKLASLVL